MGLLVTSKYMAVISTMLIVKGGHFTTISGHSEEIRLWAISQ